MTNSLTCQSLPTLVLCVCSRSRIKEQSLHFEINLIFDNEFQARAQSELSIGHNSIAPTSPWMLAIATYFLSIHSISSQNYLGPHNS